MDSYYLKHLGKAIKNYRGANSVLFTNVIMLFW